MEPSDARRAGAVGVPAWPGALRPGRVLVLRHLPRGGGGLPALEQAIDVVGPQGVDQSYRRPVLQPRIAGQPGGGGGRNGDGAGLADAGADRDPALEKYLPSAGKRDPAAHGRLSRVAGRCRFRLQRLAVLARAAGDRDQDRPIAGGRRGRGRGGQGYPGVHHPAGQGPQYPGGGRRRQRGGRPAADGAAGGRLCAGLFAGLADAGGTGAGLSRRRGQG